MYHQIYKAVAAATVAGSLILSAGQATALDFNFNTNAATSNVAIPGCDATAGLPGGVWHVMVNDLGSTTITQRSFEFRIGEGQSGIALAFVNIQNTGTINFWGGEAVQLDFGSFVFGISQYCSNLTFVADEVVTGFNEGPAGYAAADFAGTVFLAVDSNDGQTYRYTAGFEGVTNTVGVFRRELVSTGTPDADATNEGIADATLARARAALANQPNLTPLLADRPEWYFNANAGNDTAFLRFIKGPVWFNLDYSRSTVGMLDNDIIHGVLGSHKQFSPNLIVGSMLQFDIIDSAGGDFTQTSNGFLAGPYFVASNPARTLFVDGSLLYGKSWNEISPTGAYTDDYTSERWLATVKVSGNIERDAFTLRPNVNVKYVSDENESYVDSLGNDIAASGVTIAQAAIGLDAIIPVAVASGSLDLLLGVSGIHSEESFTGASADIRDDLSQSRGRIDLGFEWQGEAGSVFTASMFYDGLGADDFEAQGLSLAYHITF